MTEQKLVNPSLETKKISKRCIVDGCHNPKYTRHYCTLHYLKEDKPGISWKEFQGLGWIFAEEDF